MGRPGVVVFRDGRDLPGFMGLRGGSDLVGVLGLAIDKDKLGDATKGFLRASGMDSERAVDFTENTQTHSTQ